MTDEANTPASGPNTMDILGVFVEAHALPDPRTGQREPIYYHESLGGTSLQHHALPEQRPEVDEAALDELVGQGLLREDYTSSQYTRKFTPTPEGRRVVEQQARVDAEDPAAPVEPLIAALEAQEQASNKLAWPVVRPVLQALRDYWEVGGMSPHGIQLRALVQTVPNHRLLATTIRALVNNGYLVPTTNLALAAPASAGLGELPMEVALTERTHEALDGWPGAIPSELVENLLAVLSEEAEAEPDPDRKKRLRQVAQAVRDVGVETAGAVLAKAMTGGM